MMTIKYTMSAAADTIMPNIENSCNGTIEKPVTRSKLRRISRYNEYFDSPAARASCATSTSVGWLAYVYASAGM